MNTSAPTPPSLPDLGQLPTSEVCRILHEAQDILAARTEARLPGLAFDKVKEVLSETDPSAVPLSATFGTSAWENGVFWRDHEVHVVLTDGSTRVLDLSETLELSGVLADHSEYVGPDSSDCLLITFDPFVWSLTR
ncbi:hypothetical protein [Streptomyces diastaticus]|uniref:hypothetical protein n=1 Tax=Streptomyces diastaticus TaxID=1956 RepID=UPI00365A29C6